MHDVCYHDPEPASKVDPLHRWPQYDAIVARAHRQGAGRPLPERRRVPQRDPGRVRAAGGQHDLRGDDRHAPLALGVAEAAPEPQRHAVAAAKTFAVSSTERAAAHRLERRGAGRRRDGDSRKFVGPVAKVLVRRAAKEHKDLESLVGALMPTIDDPKERSAFAKAVLGKPHDHADARCVRGRPTARR